MGIFYLSVRSFILAVENIEQITQQPFKNALLTFHEIQLKINQKEE